MEVLEVNPIASSHCRWRAVNRATAIKMAMSQPVTDTSPAALLLCVEKEASHPLGVALLVKGALLRAKAEAPVAAHGRRKSVPAPPHWHTGVVLPLQNCRTA